MPPAIVRSSSKSDELPSPSLLPSLSKSPRSSFLLTSQVSSTSLSQHFSSFSSSSSPAILSSSAPLRPSTSPSPSSSQFHQPRLTSASPPPSSSSSSKPRWFTNRLALSLPSSSSHLDFSRYQSHASAQPYNPNEKHWTRDDMIKEIVREHMKQKQHLKLERERLNKELARKEVTRNYRKYREEILIFMQEKTCRLFEGATKIISVKDRELDRLIEAGGVEELENGRRGYMNYIIKLNAEKIKCSSFEQLVKYVRKARKEAEENIAPSPARLEEEEPKEKEEPAGSKVQPTEAERPAVEEEKKANAVEQQERKTEEIPRNAESSSDQDDEDAAEERKDQLIEPRDEDKFIEPSQNRQRMDSICSPVGEKEHARNNTVAGTATIDDGSASGVGGFNMGNLMEKLGELEEEQEKEEEKENIDLTQHEVQPTSTQEDVEFANDGNADEAL